jgi:trypsin-like peptidase
MSIPALAVVISMAFASALAPATLLIHRVNVFSADGSDPRRAQAHIGSDRVFAAIGWLTTDHGVPESQGPIADPARDTPAPIVDQDGTAFLVSPCYALTAYHVVFGSSRMPSREFTSTLFIFEGSGDSVSATRAVPATWGAMAHAQETDNDWALLKLDDCVGKRVGWLKISENPGTDWQKLRVASVGFAADKDASTLWGDTCNLYPGRIGEFLDDCAVTAGSSGSPILVSRAGHLEVVALSEGEFNHRAEILRGYSTKFANIATDIRAIGSVTMRFITDDIAAFAAPNPADEP